MQITEPVLKSLIHSLHPAVINTVKGIVKREDIAEDIAMITWQTLWERRACFRTVEELRGFLFVAAKNMAFTYLKGEKIRANIIRDNVEFNEHTASALMSIENDMFINDAFKALVKRFHYKYACIFLKTIEGKSNTQISVELNIPASTVTTIRSRIITYLRNVF
jgi:RNA polymerase sigma factor (sigma-70 family)